MARLTQDIRDRILAEWFELKESDLNIIKERSLRVSYGT